MSTFTLSEYQSLIRLAKERFTFCNYNEFSGSNKIIWRHDLEYSLQEMHNLAKIDIEEGIPSVVFVQIRSAFFNSLSKRAKEMFDEWIAGGLEIGLHFDWEYYSADLSSLEKNIEKDKKILEEFIGFKIKSFSYHNPNDTILKYRGHYAGMLNAYGPEFFLSEDVFYISDSNGRWRNRSLRQILSDQDINKLQVNLHDTWWSEDNIKQISKLDKAFEAEAKWKSNYYRNLAAVIVDEIL